MKAFAIHLYLTVLLAMAVFATCQCFADWDVEPKWYGSLIIGGIGMLLFAIWYFFSDIDACAVLKAFEVSAIMVSTALALYGIAQWSGVLRHRTLIPAGSFYNVTGYVSCLCLCLPLGWRWFDGEWHWKKILVSLSKVICVLAIFLSGSRTGMLCIILLLSIKFIGFRKSIILFALAILLLAFSVKTDSTRGRWFICQRTAELISQRPLFGWGVGGFDAHYMDVQADYFSLHPDSEYAMFADNVRHPLNEFLLVAVDFGLIGLAFLLVSIVFVLSYYHSHKTECGRLGIDLFTCILIFSMFSYPFLYPFTWIMLVVSLCCIFDVKWRRYFSLFAILIVPIALFVTVRKANRSLTFAQVQERSKYAASRRLLERYEQLYPNLKSDYRFLYSYASTQFDAGQYSSALKTANECSALLADYNLCLLKGDIYRERKQHLQSMGCYKRAANMCPSRFTPLYEMFCIYRERHDTIAALDMAKTIKTKPVKVGSQRINEIIEDVNETIENYKIKTTKNN